MTKELFFRMMDETHEFIDFHKLKGNHERIELISGGAAWSDHIAVQLFLDHDIVKSLTLFSPAEFDVKQHQFHDNGVFAYLKNPGRLANLRFHEFSKIMGRNMIKDISIAVQRGAKIIVNNNGFHARNTQIAHNATHLLAFSWSLGDQPCDGGTKDTWQKFLKKHNNDKMQSAQQKHISLCLLQKQ